MPRAYRPPVFGPLGDHALRAAVTLRNAGVEAREDAAPEAAPALPGLRREAQADARPPQAGGGQRPQPYRPAHAGPGVPRGGDAARAADSDTADAGATAAVAPASGPEDVSAKVEHLFRYFVNRQDIYSVETDDGWRTRRVRGGDLDWSAALTRHLDGDLTLGVYTTNENDEVRWVCFDIDTLDMAPLMALVSVLPEPFMVEETGGRGRHVWQFFKTPVSAGMAKAYGDSMVRRANASPVEVYPKQAHLNGGLGNLVRLPLGVHHRSQQRSKFLMGEWGYLDPSHLVVPPTPEVARSPEMASGSGGRSADEWISAMFDGDTDLHGGRNNTLSRWAWLLYNLGCPPAFVRHAVEYVNENCIEPLPEDELGRLLDAKQRAFERRQG